MVPTLYPRVFICYIFFYLCFCGINLLSHSSLTVFVLQCAQTCLTLYNPRDFNLPDSSVQGDSPSKNTGMGCHAFLQGIFPNPGVPHCGQILYHLSHQASPRILESVAYPFLASPGEIPNSGAPYLYGINGICVFTNKSVTKLKKKLSLLQSFGIYIKEVLNKY